MSMYEQTVPQFIRLLGQVQRWLDKAQAYAEQKKFDPEVFMSTRLAPDQFPLVRQIQILTDLIKGGCSRIAGVTPPVYEDKETTLAEIRARVDKTIAYLQTLKREQFQGAEERNITLPFIPGKYMTGTEHLVEFVLPNVYFHATTAYAILRANGVDLGKMDFLGDISLRDLQA